MRAAAALLVALFFPALLEGQALPGGRDRFYRDVKAYWLPVAADWSVIFLDYHSTARAMARDPAGADLSPLLGLHPSPRRIAAAGISEAGAMALVQYVCWRVSHRDPSRWWRAVGRWGLPIVLGSLHARNAAINYRVKGP